MNYLAHIYLSAEDEQLKIGNFIADSVKGKKYLNYPEKIQKGIILHRSIDSFTDSHDTVKKSVHRLFPIYGHYSTVIVDILYDHFLAANWHEYSKIPLPQYTSAFYQLLKDNFQHLPKRVQQFLPIMIDKNWLLSYKTIEGIEKILFQMNQRTKNRSQMHLAVHELELYYSDFKREFTMFFEELETYTNKKITQL
ncbi:acyl carrier protein phosphodiesterase [Gillisia sp. M10.2A]|uniref:Acyl carrier protein phosphodiesterase n=1 Tax=Gillisia lutea TaxID=2909668 RepID=A0ABS9EL90_9FLAO|nr:acyl carrier protein phosphodiesterase [Gillisia lutea]MCF4102629.1 acyl carrier protein phosphodiesterase [Gillisia lutea]